MFKQHVKQILIAMVAIAAVVLVFMCGCINQILAAVPMKDEVIAIVTEPSATISYELEPTISYEREPTLPRLEAEEVRYEIEYEYNPLQPNHEAHQLLANENEEIQELDEQISENKTEEKSENLESSCRKWFNEHKSDATRVTVWKKVINENQMYVALKDENDNFLVTFTFSKDEFDWLDTATVDSEWQCCTTTYKQTLTLQELVDVAYMTYWEVSGNDLVEVQIQTQVVVNRTNHSGFEDTLRDAINEPKQYACKYDVSKRRLKKGNESIEKDDLERCYQSVLLFFAAEYGIEVPENVVWAATGKQGRGVWMYRNGTYYCY